MPLKWLINNTINVPKRLPLNYTDLMKFLTKYLPAVFYIT